MRILKDFKIPDFKFPKLKMKEISEIDELKVDYEAVRKEQEKQKKTEHKNYETTNYSTIREVFDEVIKKYSEKVLLLEKTNPKGAFGEITYKQFGEEVIAFSTALLRKLKLNAPRVIIIGENTHHWYLSYMTMLCSDGIAIPVDKELPENELENVIKRAKADVVVFSTKKCEIIKRIIDKLPDVKYFIQMNSDEEINGRTVGLNYLLEEGKILAKNDNYFQNVVINPDDFKVLIFTSGTTSNSKGVMLSSRNLAENLNAVFAYVKIYDNDRLLSILPLHHTYESSIGFLVPFAKGASIAVCQGLKYIVPDLKEAKPTVLLTVPLLVESLYKKITNNIKKSKKETDKDDK